MDARRKVREFCETNDVEGRPEFQLLGLASEVGELGRDARESRTGAGARKRSR
jgi:hypothetical protein